MDTRIEEAVLLIIRTTEQAHDTRSREELVQAAAETLTQLTAEQWAQAISERMLNIGVA